MATKRTQNKKEESKLEKQPDVIVDFENKEGLLFIIIENIGNDSAYNTSIRFDKKIAGMQNKRISSLRIFKSLKFLPPRKKIKVMVDLFQSYLANKQPLQIKINISFRNKQNQRFKNFIQHDLTIYKGITEVYSIKKIS